MTFRSGFALTAAAPLLLAACTSAPQATKSSTAPSPSTAVQAKAVPWPAGGCDPRVRKVLPTWARAGFSDKGAARMPHVMSSRGDIVAALFAYPTRAWPSDRPDDGSKILWISRVPQQPMSPLKIDAYLDGSQRPVHREVDGGPGPSLMKLPQPGCWRLRLSWSGHSDTIDLEVAPPAAGRA
ncbi:hypothetical protein [Actinomadura sp. HBU206391]|uniref:hypothetical protein n=1 Tax=Actinomadura sp. HBU206391 TaxID=2731692 RepID=UPI00164EDFD9|nr:hypothetical protein [Actinomadura sp. HBU206391]MBC6458468.1 hypothetical protein [Actinomadura sp. HBU206391]